MPTLGNPFVKEKFKKNEISTIGDRLGLLRLVIIWEMGLADFTNLLYQNSFLFEIVVSVIEKAVLAVGTAVSKGETKISTDAGVGNLLLSTLQIIHSVFLEPPIYNAFVQV